jgi:hypothetical protein
MAVDDAVRRIGPYLREIAASLGEAAWPPLNALLHGLAEADDVSRPRRAQELVFFLAERLPAEHPVRRALLLDPTAPDDPNDPTSRRRRRWRGGVSADLDGAVAEFRAELASTEQAVELNPNPPTVLALVRRDLLAAPSRAAAEIRAFGQDPHSADLVRLTTPAGEVVLPAFQFKADGRQLPIVAQVNDLLGAHDDPWGVASWWLDRNSWLGGVPAELLGRVPDSHVLAAARADLEVD